MVDFFKVAVVDFLRFVVLCVVCFFKVTVVLLVDWLRLCDDVFVTTKDGLMSSLWLRTVDFVSEVAGLATKAMPVMSCRSATRLWNALRLVRLMVGHDDLLSNCLLISFLEVITFSSFCLGSVKQSQTIEIINKYTAFSIEYTGNNVNSD